MSYIFAISCASSYIALTKALFVLHQMQHQLKCSNFKDDKSGQIKYRNSACPHFDAIEQCVQGYRPNQA